MVLILCLKLFQLYYFGKGLGVSLKVDKINIEKTEIKENEDRAPTINSNSLTDGEKNLLKYDQYHVNICFLQLMLHIYLHY